jgi:hypothetical protein
MKSMPKMTPLWQVSDYMKFARKCFLSYFYFNVKDSCDGKELPTGSMGGFDPVYGGRWSQMGRNGVKSSFTHAGEISPSIIHNFGRNSFL